MSTDQPDVAAVATLLADPARARMLLALSANDRLTASTLAEQAGLSAPATSAHLRKLLDGELVTVTRAGRCRYYQIAGRDVVAALETLARLACPHPSHSLRQSNRDRALYYARVCYDHLAGWLSAHIVDGLLAQGAITPLATPAAALGDAIWTTGPHAHTIFTELGIPRSLLPDGNAPAPLQPCLDWSTRRPHLAGPLGAALLATMLEHRWLTKHPHHRTLRPTSTGTHALNTILDLQLPHPTAPNPAPTTSQPSQPPPRCEPVNRTR